MSAVFSFLLIPHICWPLGLLIIELIAMIFGILEPPGVYWLAMTKLSAMRNSWTLKHLFLHPPTIH